MISIETVVRVFVYLLCVGGVFWLLFWLVSYIAPPEPFNKVIRIFLAVAAVLLLIGVLLHLAGHPIIRF